MGTCPQTEPATASRLTMELTNAFLTLWPPFKAAAIKPNAFCDGKSSGSTARGTAGTIWHDDEDQVAVGWRGGGGGAVCVGEVVRAATRGRRRKHLLLPGVAHDGGVVAVPRLCVGASAAALVRTGAGGGGVAGSFPRHEGAADVVHARDWFLSAGAGPQPPRPCLAAGSVVGARWCWRCSC